MKSDHRSKFSNWSNWQEEAWKKKSGLFFRLHLSNRLNWKIYCDDNSSLSFTTAVQIWIISHTLHITKWTTQVLKTLWLMTERFSSHFFWLDSGVKLLFKMNVFLYINVVAFLFCKILVVARICSWCSVNHKNWNQCEEILHPKLIGRGPISYLSGNHLTKEKCCPVLKDHVLFSELFLL